MENWLKGITQKAKEKAKGAAKAVSNWFTPDDNPDVRMGEFLREVPGATANIAKEVGRGFARFGLSAGEAVASVPLDAYKLINPKAKYEIPIYEPEKIPGLGFLGDIESYQNQARRETSEGEQGFGSFLKAAGNIAMDEPVGVALKPLGIAFGAFTKGGGFKALAELVPKRLKGVADDVLKEDFTAIKNVDPENIKKVQIFGSSVEGKAKPRDIDVFVTVKDDAAKFKQKDGLVDPITFERGRFSYVIMPESQAQELLDAMLYTGRKDPDRAYSGTAVTVPKALWGPQKLEPAKAAAETYAEAGKKIQKLGGFSKIDEMPLPQKNVYGADQLGQSLGLDPKFLYENATAKGIDLKAELDAFDALRGEKGTDAVLPFSNDLMARLTGDAPAPKVKAPKAAKAPAQAVSRETETPESVGSMRSIGDILAEGGTKAPDQPPVPRVTHSGSGKERRFITRTRALDPKTDKYLKGEYTPRSTAELAELADDIIKNDPAGAEAMAKEGLDDQAVAVASRLVDNMITQARSAEGAAKDALYEKAADIANEAAKNLTEHGRAIQAATLLGQMTPEGMVRYAARQIQKYNEEAGERTVKNFLGMAKKIPELTGEQAKRITDQMEEIVQMADGKEKNKAMQKLQDEIRAMVPDTLYKKIVTLWKAGLLTGLKTTGLNISSNLSHFVTETVKDAPAALVDRIASMFTGKRTLAMTTKGTGRGLKEGAAKGWEYFRTGFDERNIGAKLDYRKVNFGTSKFAKALQAYEETVFKTIGSQDQPFYYGAKARSLYSQAIAQAKNQGLRGESAKEFVEKLVAEPTDDMLRYAILDAETAVFQQSTALGKVARAIQNAPGGEIILPFGKTPSAVATQMINYTPVGIVSTIVKNIGKGRFDQRLFAQGIGRGLTGTGALAVGMALMSNKMMNLGYPTSEKEREQWELEGRIPNSIYIGGRWRNVGVLGPAGMVLLLGGHMQSGIEETGSWAGGLATAAGGVGNALTEQSFLKGINQAIDAIQDPKRSFEGFASSLAGSIIPTIIADWARATDDYERISRNPGERIQSRIPGARQGLEPRVDTFGNKVKTPNFLETMADPTRPGNPTDADDPVTKELRRLLDADYGVTPTQLGDKEGYESLTPEQNTKLWELGGRYVRQKLEEEMRGRRYGAYDDEEKQSALQDATDEAKVEARAYMVAEVTRGLTGDALKAKLAEMREDGLLTQQVFKKYRALTR